MVYWLLLILGILIGAVFLLVLLVGDKREANREAQRKALLEDMKQANKNAEHVWPPPPKAPALPYPSAFSPLLKSTRPSGNSRQIMRIFYWVRNYAIGAVLIAYIVCACFPRLPFGSTLLTTGILAVVLVINTVQRNKPR